LFFEYRRIFRETFLTLRLHQEEILEIVDLALSIKENKKLRSPIIFSGADISNDFESSTRTRVSFESGMFQLGGHALFLSNRDIHLGAASRKGYCPCHIVDVRYGNNPYF
jgi:ornithine carbamoyltransferase